MTSKRQKQKASITRTSLKQRQKIKWSKQIPNKIKSKKMKN